MKTIRISSHVFKDKPKVICEDGDVYDSKIEVFENGKLIFQSNIVNVDSSKKILPAVIELQNGTYCAIMGIHNNRIKGLFICAEKYKKDLQEAGNWKALLDDNFIAKRPGIRYLPAINPNPRWNNDKSVNACNIHDGGFNYDWSEGCITIYYSDYAIFKELFELNEVVEIIKQ